MADETARLHTISNENPAELEDPEDLVVRTSGGAPSQRASRVRRHSDVRMEDWQEAERLVMEDMKRGRKPGP